MYLQASRVGTFRRGTIALTFTSLLILKQLPCGSGCLNFIHIWLKYRVHRHNPHKIVWNYNGQSVAICTCAWKIFMAVLLTENHITDNLISFPYINPSFLCINKMHTGTHIFMSSLGHVLVAMQKWLLGFPVF